MKYVVAVVIVVALLWLIRRQRRRPAPPPSSRPQGDTGTSAPALMARCARCGVHLAERDAVRAGGEVFCSDEHRVEHARGPG